MKLTDRTLRAVQDRVPSPCYRYLTRTIRAGKFRLYCDLAGGHEGEHALSNGATWTTEGTE